MNISAIQTVLSSLSKRRVLVIGDVMLDHYLSGRIERISPEAPVPVVEVLHEEYRLGGAANVALNLQSLGAQAILIGIIGDDRDGQQFQELLQQSGIQTKGIHIVANRPTTVKTRIMAKQQQIVRVDREICTEIKAAEQRAILKRIKVAIPTVDAVIIEDYDKGLLTSSLIHQILELCKAHDKQVTVDPKFQHFFNYAGVTVFKPNFKELQSNLGITIVTENDFVEAAATLQERINCDHLVITRGSKGLTIFSKGKHPIQLPTFAKEVFDVSGAGDTVISVLTLGMAAGLPIREAALLANHAAGVVCGKMGTSSVTSEEILASLLDHQKVHA